jgi:hypothetical protein
MGISERALKLCFPDNISSKILKHDDAEYTLLQNYIGKFLSEIPF